MSFGNKQKDKNKPSLSIKDDLVLIMMSGYLKRLKEINQQYFKLATKINDLLKTIKIKEGFLKEGDKK